MRFARSAMAFDDEVSSAGTSGTFSRDLADVGFDVVIEDLRPLAHARPHPLDGVQQRVPLVVVERRTRARDGIVEAIKKMGPDFVVRQSVRLRHVKQRPPTNSIWCQNRRG